MEHDRDHVDGKKGPGDYSSEYCASARVKLIVSMVDFDEKQLA
jgi:hypothetical protein